VRTGTKVPSGADHRTRTRLEDVGSIPMSRVDRSRVSASVASTPFGIRRDDGRCELGVSISLQLPDGEGDVAPSGPDVGDPARIR
jgi:hypothetical protein